MKKLLLSFILIFLIQPCASPLNISKAEASITYYAKIENSSTYLYSSPIKTDENRIFEIPVSYYVLLIGNENENFYKAKYSNVEGFVLKNMVTPVKENPNYPYAMTSFRLFSPVDLPLYSLPNSSSIKGVNIPSLETITTFYGKIPGEELIPNSTNIWYYCAYFNEGIYEKGYIFSYYCDNFQAIQTNTEFFTEITEDLIFENEPIVIPSTGISNAGKVLIGVACALPCLIILLLLVKKKTSTPTKQKKIIKRPHKDYYEFNEDDI